MNAIQENTQSKRSRTSQRWGVFFLLQVALIASVAAATVWRERQWRVDQALPALRNVPRAVVPRYDRPEVVSDEQLRFVLLKLRPRLNGPQPKINHADHALRFWGLDAQFDDPQFTSGVDLRALLIDQRRFARAWGSQARPFLMPDRDGVAVRTREGNATASHTDHTLSVLAEVGTTLDEPVFTTRGQTNMAALVRSSLSTFSLNQGEYEWSALTYALYFEAFDPWVTRDGQRIDFDMLAARLMREPHRQGVCFGNHRLYTLAALLQLDEQEHFLLPATRSHVLEYLGDVTARLVRNQHALGYWDGNWANAPAASGNDGGEIANRLLATGHALEWWAIAPAELQPPREVLVRAGQWLAHEVEALDDGAVQRHYTYLTHVGRALALWRGIAPAEVLPPQQPTLVDPAETARDGA